MNLSFFQRLLVKKLVVKQAGPNEKAAQQALELLLAGIPEPLLAYVADNTSGQVLAYFTSDTALNPNRVSVPNARLFAQKTAKKGTPLAEQLREATVLLTDQVHHLRSTHQGNWHCFVAVRTADTNLALVREVMRGLPS